MEKAKKGDSVKVHYTGKFTDGNVFDSSVDREPLEFTIGAGMMIPGFDDAVDGMSKGEKVTAEIPAAKAYGDRRDDLVIDIAKDQFPPDIKPEVGQRLAMNSNGQQVPVVVTNISEEKVEIDANHELAGKDLVFEIELVEIK